MCRRLSGGSTSSRTAPRRISSAGPGRSGYTPWGVLPCSRMQRPPGIQEKRRKSRCSCSRRSSRSEGGTSGKKILPIPSGPRRKAIRDTTCLPPPFSGCARCSGMTGPSCSAAAGYRSTIRYAGWTCGHSNGSASGRKSWRSECRAGLAPRSSDRSPRRPHASTQGCSCRPTPTRHGRSRPARG